MAQAFIDPTAFEAEAAAALGARQFARAFTAADRRCRDERPAEALSYVLRADALFGLGDRTAAVEDVVRARELEPDNLHANRRLLAWGSARQRVEAALALAPTARDLSLQRSCAHILSAAGRKAFAAASVLSEEIVGWAYWGSEAPLELACIEGDRRFATMIERDPSAPLGEDFTASARFRTPRPPASGQQHVTLGLCGEILLAISAPPNRRPARPAGAPRARGADEGEVAIILPVHSDFEATDACLSSLMRQLPEMPGTRVIIVDDASPDPRIVGLLDEIAAAHPQVRLLRNWRNLGFVGAVNRALAECGAADVILLNADTIVPPGFVGRLKAAAHASPDIGTVTPLSNNGELTSFPVFARVNPLPSSAEVDRIDAAASRINAAGTVDLPNGIGFCLYIKRACLNAIGFLSEGYQRGYYEDVDWCLAARERGFRNVCATGVFVGHAGSRSFGSEKRGLVLRNLAVLEQRYPEHIAEVAAFVAADPLREARAALEQAIASDALPGALGFPQTKSHHRSVIAGLGPAIHEFASASSDKLVDARAKPGHDGEGVSGASASLLAPREPLGVIGAGLRELPFLKRLAHLARERVAVLGPPLFGMEGLWPAKLIATGALEPAELAGLIARHGLGALVLLEGAATSAHPLKEAALATGLACAFIDWSRGDCRPRPHDLALDPDMPWSERAKAIVDWAAS